MRKKEVFKTSEIAHIWASQQQEYGRVSAGNMSFQGLNFYSYSTIIARLILGDDGQPCAAIISTRRYSNTTDGHIHAVRAAVQHLKIVRAPMAYESPTKNLEWVLSEMETISKSLEKARKPEKHLDQIGRWCRQYRDYLSVFDEDTHRLVMESPKYQELLAYEILSNGDGVEEYRQQLAIASAAEAERLKKVREEEAKLVAQITEKWLSGAISYGQTGYMAGGSLWREKQNEAPLLRLVREDNEYRVETSMGIVSFPLEVAKTAIRLYYAGRLEAGARLEHYIVREVTEEYVRIGCHTFMRAEIDRFWTIVANIG